MEIANQLHHLKPWWDCLVGLKEMFENFEDLRWKGFECLA